MRVTSLFLVVALAGGGAFPALADPLGDAAADILAESPDLRFERVDLDQDGKDEGFLASREPCSSPCPFAILDKTGSGGIGVVVRQSAKKAVLQGTASGGKVVDADGVIYAWDGYEMFPHFDLLPRVQDRQATGDDREIVKDATGQDYYAPDMTAYDVDLVDDQEKETVLIINSAFVNGMAPFHVFDASGDRIYHGYSVDRPRIYKVTEQGEKRARILWVTPSGFRLETIN